VITAHKELDAFLDRKATVFHVAVMNLARAKLMGGDLEKARKDLAETIQRTMILADLNGRRRLLAEYDYAKAKAAKFADVPQSSPIAPGITFEEAVEDMFKRDPRLERSSAEISRLYSTQKVFAMARSAEMTITRRAQDEITKWLGSGDPGMALEKTLEEIGPFSRAYAETVFRTNAATAYNEGRIEQSKDEDVAEVIVGFRFEGIDDAFTRDNHRAGFGSIAATDHPTWKMHKPPLGYNCRCSLEFVSVYEAERLGLWKDGKLTPMLAPNSAWYPDPGFRVEG
jgi:SPP1 gp7 family putative phage head morphogenesis protein